jgi:hypothetical protein
VRTTGARLYYRVEAQDSNEAYLHPHASPRPTMMSAAGAADPAPGPIGAPRWRPVVSGDSLPMHLRYCCLVYIIAISQPEVPKGP